MLNGILGWLRRWWPSPRRRGGIDDDVEDEIRFHLEMRTRANVAAGMDPAAARRDAERRFGDRERVRRAGRELLSGARPARDGASQLEELAQDVRYGARTLARNRFTTAAAVLSLALGIGANSATFSVVYGMLFRELPFEGGDRLLYLDAWNPQRGDGDAPLTWADIEAMRGIDALEGVAAFTTRSFTVTGGDHPERVAGAAVTPGLFELLGVRPQRGRRFRPGEGAEPGFEPVALLSDGLWHRMFGADPGVVGETIHLNGRELVVVGIMPPRFRFPERHDLWLPLGTDDPGDHRRRYLFGLAKLRPGAGLAAVQGPVDAWVERASRVHPQTHRGWDVRVQPFRHGYLDAAARQGMALLMGAVGFVLLLACANVANLLLAQATERHQELAVRAALGAGRGRLARQVVVESLMLGLAGGVLGVLVAWGWLQVTRDAVPEEMAFWMDVRLDVTVLLYTLAVSLGTGLLFGLLPAFQASRAGLSGHLRDAGRGVFGGDGGGAWRSALVVGEVALSVVVLIGATLMVRSFLELQAADPGFDHRRMVSLRLTLAGDRYDDPVTRASYFREVTDRLEALPGVVAAAATGAIPADDGGAAVSVMPEGAAGPDEALYAVAVPSSRGFFRTLGVDLLAGRDFTAGEVADERADVAVVGDTLARRLWAGQDPLGRLLEMPGTGTFRVIGVAPDLQYEEFLEETEATRLQVHLPYGEARLRGMAVLVRTAGPPGSLVNAVREAVVEVDPTQAPYDLLTMPDRRSYTTWPQQVFGGTFGAFGLIALALALCGVYGVVAYSVARRTREMGVRIALGARPRNVQAAVVGAAVRLAGIGVVLGSLLGLLCARGLRGLLYGVTTTDPTVFAGVGLLLLVAAALASWGPARRAAGVDPMTALRTD